jgi:hypothetical protein
MKATLLVMLDNSKSADLADALFIEKIEIQRKLMVPLAAGGRRIDSRNAVYHGKRVGPNRSLSERTSLFEAMRRKEYGK